MKSKQKDLDATDAWPRVTPAQAAAHTGPAWGATAVLRRQMQVYVCIFRGAEREKQKK